MVEPQAGLVAPEVWDSACYENGGDVDGRGVLTKSAWWRHISLACLSGSPMLKCIASCTLSTASTR